MVESKTATEAPIKLKKRMGFGLIAASAIFFFNPDISVIDVFPDIFGYILLTMGLSQLSLLNEHIEDAYSKFKKMILVSGAKIASLIFLFGMSDAANRPYLLLLFSFSFGVIELILLIPAYRELFKGILTVADRQGSRVAYYSKKTGGMSYAEKIQMLTVAFVIFKAVSATWPECISLVNTEYTDSFVMYMYDYIGAFRIIAFVPTLVFGIIWLVKSRAFFTKLGNESEFIENIKRSFEKDLFPKRGLFIRRTLNAVILILTVAAIFCVDFSLGSVGVVGDSAAELNILPDAVAAILILSATQLLGRYVDDTKRTRICSVVFLATSLISSFMKVLFVARFDYYTAVNKLDEAYSMFNFMCLVTVIENAAFVATVVFLTMTLREMIKKYTGYSAYADDRNSERVTSLQSELTGKLKYMVIFAVLSAVSAVMYEFFLPEKHLLAQYMWIIDLIVQAVFAAVTLSCLFSIKDEMENKFILE